MIVYTLLFTVGAKVMKNRQNLFSPLAFSILFRVFAAVNNEIPLSNMKTKPYLSLWGAADGGSPTQGILSSSGTHFIFRRKVFHLLTESAPPSDGKLSVLRRKAFY
jgi:hypothetical protein